MNGYILWQTQALYWLHLRDTDLIAWLYQNANTPFLSKRLTWIWITIIKTWRSSDRFIFIMGILYLMTPYCSLNIKRDPHRQIRVQSNVKRKHTRPKYLSAKIVRRLGNVVSTKTWEALVSRLSFRPSRGGPNSVAGVWFRCRCTVKPPI